MPGGDGPATLGDRLKTAMERKQFDEALALLCEAAANDPSDANALRQQGNLLTFLGDLEAAEGKLREAAAIRPDSADILVDLGNVLLNQGELDQAITVYRRAQSLEPGHPVAAGNEALALLLSGDYRQGLPKYESRWRHPPLSTARPKTGLPLWRGEDPGPDARILVFPEQGLGDAIMMSRYLPPLARRFADVACIAPEPLVRLFRHGLGDAVTIVTDRDAAADGGFTHHCPVMSLPLAFGTDLDSIPDCSGVLRPDADDAAAWAARTPTGRRLRVGLVWAGRRDNAMDRVRSLPLRAFRPVLALDGVAWFSLQKDEAAAEIGALGLEGRIHDPMGDCRDFMDTASLVATLDLVISVDTAVAHLAGALGTPVWLLNRFQSEWRWLRGRNDSPWYPTMRIFTQPRPGEWMAVLDDVTARLRLQAGRRQIRLVRRARPIVQP